MRRQALRGSHSSQRRDLSQQSIPRRSHVRALFWRNLSRILVHYPQLAGLLRLPDGYGPAETDSRGPPDSACPRGRLDLESLRGILRTRLSQAYSIGHNACKSFISLQLASSAFESQLKYLLLGQDCFMLSRPETKVAHILLRRFQFASLNHCLKLAAWGWLALVLLRAEPTWAATTVDASTLEVGYRQMYNLDFDSAHQTFAAWERSHPQDPMGPVSNAAAYLFAEFDRLHILESEFFTNDKKFENRQRFEPDLKTRSTFEAELTRADQLSDQILSRAPQDGPAMFSKVMV